MSSSDPPFTGDAAPVAGRGCGSPAVSRSRQRCRRSRDRCRRQEGHRPARSPSGGGQPPGRVPPAMLGTTRPSHRRRPLLNDVYQAHTVREPWQAGDLVLVDNVRTARSREARTGRREVLAGLAAPSARGVLADDRGGWALTPVEPAVQQPTLPAVPPFAGSPEPRSGTCCRKEIVELVGATYRPHGAGESVSPQSYLLRFPAARPRASWRCPPSRGGEPGSTVWSRSPASRTRPGRDAAGLGPADPQRPRHRLPRSPSGSFVISATGTAAPTALAADCSAAAPSAMP